MEDSENVSVDAEDPECEGPGTGCCTDVEAPSFTEEAPAGCGLEPSTKNNNTGIMNLFEFHTLHFQKLL